MGKKLRLLVEGIRQTEGRVEPRSQIQDKWGPRSRGVNGEAATRVKGSEYTKLINIFVLLRSLLQVSLMSQPSATSSRTSPSLMSVEIAPWIMEEMEERREREKIMWRRNARLARDRREAEELEARAVEEAAYPVVRARMGAVGDGRERSQVRLVLVYFIQT